MLEGNPISDSGWTENDHNSTFISLALVALCDYRFKAPRLREEFEQMQPNKRRARLVQGETLLQNV